jgi:hypothetical protein
VLSQLPFLLTRFTSCPVLDAINIIAKMLLQHGCFRNYSLVGPAAYGIIFSISLQNNDHGDARRKTGYAAQIPGR